MIRVVHADDHRLFRLGLAELLRAMHGIQIVGTAETGEDAISQVRSLRPNTVLMDVLMPGMGGLEATARILKSEPSTAVIALTECTEVPFPAQMLKAGALGYLTKDVEVQELEQAIKRVFMGRRYVCNHVAQELACYAFDASVESPFEILSNREMQIMLMVVNCHKVRKISGDLHLSPKTVNSYRYRIFDKLNVSSDVELVLLAVKHGVILTSLKPLPAGRASELRPAIAG
jgi:two-component system invasion response regulator UvrY